MYSHAFTLIRLIRLALLALLILLLFPSQRFWCRHAESLVANLGSPVLRRVARPVLALWLLLLVAVLLNRLVIHIAPKSDFGVWCLGLAQLWLFTSFLAFCAIKAVHAAEWVWKRLTRMAEMPAPDGAAVDQPRRTFFRYLAYTVGSVPFIAGMYGFAEERTNFTTDRVEIPMAGLPDSLDGLRIAQLSDIHAGEFMPRDQIRRAVDMANALQPHLMVITGDFVTDEHDPLEECIAELSRLRAPLGVWGCNGNHEIYAHAETKAETLFKLYGMRLLRQEAVPISWHGSTLNLIGVDYQREPPLRGKPAPMLDAVERLVRREMPNILLSHNPNVFRRAADMGIELTLAGHTHGGQIQMEIVDHHISPARFFTPYISGLYDTDSALPDKGRAFLYVNRGLGTIAIPARIGAPPEITLITLRSQGS